MTISQDHQFDLDGVTFGLGCDIAIPSEGGFDPGSADWRTQDGVNGVGDRRRYGRDYLDGPTWAWSAFTDQGSEAEALTAIEQLATVWRNESNRRTPGNMRALRYRLAGRTRRIYGRPRRFAVDAPTNLILVGRTGVSMDFVAADALTYDDALTTMSMGIIEATYSGFAVPAVAPWPSLAVVGTRSGTIVVGGTATTSMMTITFTAGPNAGLANPKVTIGGREFGLTTTLAPGRSATIDVYAQTVTGVASGELTRATRLEGVGLKPGTYVVDFDGTDSSGTGRVTLSWRSAYNGL